MKTVAICFVCLGNICRSPTAEGVMRHQVAAAKLDDRILIDSAGMGAWHIGEPPDPRARQAAARRGYDLSALRGRQIGGADFDRFDLLIGMDDSNVAALRRLSPPARRNKIQLLMAFDPHATVREVTDPYFGGEAGFETVLDQCEAACRGLLASLRAQL